MKKDIIYLKRDLYKPNVVAFDPNRLKRVEVWSNRECKLEYYDDVEDFNRSMVYDLENNWEMATRKEFNDAFIEYSRSLNETTKEL